MPRSLAPVAGRLADYGLSRAPRIELAGRCRGQTGEVVLCENVRFNSR